MFWFSHHTQTLNGNQCGLNHSWDLKSTKERQTKNSVNCSSGSHQNITFQENWSDCGRIWNNDWKGVTFLPNRNRTFPLLNKN